MKQLLIVTTRFPWPLTNGFANKNYWLIKGLSDEYDITLCIIQRTEPSINDLENVRNFCKEIKIFKPSLLDICIGLLAALLKDTPFQLAFFTSEKAHKFIKKTMPTIDIALCSVIRSIQYLIKYDGPIVMDLADSLGQVYTRDAKNLKGIRRFAYLEEGRRMCKYEKNMVHRVGLSLFFNKNEASYYESDYVSVVPHGVEEKLFNIEDTSDEFSNGVVIFGRMSFEPNVNAVEWFVDNVLPTIPENILLYAVGADPSPRLIKLSKRTPRLIITGFIENPYPALRGSISSICPIQIGGGIQNKVIESLAIGALVLVSPLAACPMPDLDKSGLIVCTKPEEWKTSILNAAASRELYDSNRKMGRNYARKHFSWMAYARAVKIGLSQVTDKTKIHKG